MQHYLIEEGDNNSIVAPDLFGSVVLATHKDTKSRVAIKRLSLDKASPQYTHMTMERRVNKHVKKLGGHANIVALVDSFEDNSIDHLVLEHCAKGSLFDVLAATTDKRFSHRDSIEYFAQIADGVAFLKKLGYAHCDLSLENVLVSATNVAKLSDFGLAADASVKKTAPVGKYFYMAPEMYDGHKYDPCQADVWSLGILLFIMLTGVAPFRQARVMDDQFEHFKQEGLGALCESLRVAHLVPTDTFLLLEGMLQINPAARLTISDVVYHLCVPEAVAPRRKLSFFQKVLDPFKGRKLSRSNSFQHHRTTF
ncbi:Aste57867_25325 [Aphanomyces stellatus]|uniref:Aste57867_25325 protein n=1 Tax=Aphanomyces stellatus TaxID=120398 RepID=A0A485LU72_9STRA|nr:hypothetical protein As57867_025247 [Aphanomyces stellatus]VFU01950.1 Aste57867_25325 [Aphanomyces stellatus]